MKTMFTSRRISQSISRQSQSCIWSISRANKISEIHVGTLVS